MPARPDEMLMLLYSALLMAGLVFSSPLWLVRMVTTQRYREGLRERLGRVPETLWTYVSGVGAGRVIWIHAVSVGEVLAASRLVAELGEALVASSGEAWRVVVSTTTRTGQALARERFGAERVFYFPLDFAWAVRAYVRVLRPAALVLMESEIWPRVLHECAKEKIPVAVINARVSDRSFKRGMKLRVLWARALKMVSLWLAQSEEDARRLVALGARTENVRVSGNLKYDVRAPKESRIAELIKEAAAGRPIVVAGSTVEGAINEWREERLVQDAWETSRDLHALLVMAPRHPERFHEVHVLASEFRMLRATDLLEGTASNAAGNWDGSIGPLEIVLLNTIGDLAAVYGVADVAIVGGSFVRSGGHNPLEPAQFGVPVVMGPSYENFRSIVEEMKAADGISILRIEDKCRDLSTASVKNADSGRDAAVLLGMLKEELVRLLTDREAAKAMGERGRRVFEAQQGATKRAVDAIVSLVQAAMVSQ